MALRNFIYLDTASLDDYLAALEGYSIEGSVDPVSYTHLDVYKRQTVVAGPFFGRRHPLAQVVNQYGEAGHDVRAQQHRLRQSQQGVDASIDLGMMRGGLRHPEQLIQFLSLIHICTITKVSIRWASN